MLKARYLKARFLKARCLKARFLKLKARFELDKPKPDITHKQVALNCLDKTVTEKCEEVVNNVSVEQFVDKPSTVVEVPKLKIPRKAPKEQAKNFDVGTKKEGLSNEMYEVKLRSRGETLYKVWVRCKE